MTVETRKVSNRSRGDLGALSADPREWKANEVGIGTPEPGGRTVRKFARVIEGNSESRPVGCEFKQIIFCRMMEDEFVISAPQGPKTTLISNIG